MNKFLLTSTIVAVAITTSATAYAYNQNYPTYGYYPYNQNDYNNQAYQEFNNNANQNLYKFSVGVDFVLGDVSYADNSFDVLSPLVASGLPEEYYSANSNNFDSSPNIVNINAGFRPFRYLGFELFYQQSLSNKEVKYQEHYSGDYRYSEGEYDIDYKTYGLDAIGFLPIFSRMDLLATIGVAQYDIDGNVKLTAYRNNSSNEWRSNSKSISDSKTALRYGAGFQIWLDSEKRTALRATYRFVDIGGDYVEDISEFAIGLRRYF
ncbi:MAG: hypothetical protein E7012_07025 [Alphaproteobacteria bacterium]|nr:hypothetical protein [Alphaproteobacteria bacterium]